MPATSKQHNKVLIARAAPILEYQFEQIVLIKRRVGILQEEYRSCRDEFANKAASQLGKSYIPHSGLIFRFKSFPNRYEVFPSASLIWVAGKAKFNQSRARDGLPPITSSVREKGSTGPYLASHFKKFIPHRPENSWELPLCLHFEGEIAPLRHLLEHFNKTNLLIRDCPPFPSRKTSNVLDDILGTK